MGDALIPIGLVGTLAGLISLARPLSFLRISTRRRAGIVAAVGFAVMLAGAAISRPVEPTGSAPTSQGSAPVLAGSGDTDATPTDVPPTVHSSADTLPNHATSTSLSASTATSNPRSPAQPTSTTTTDRVAGEVAMVVEVVDGDTIRVRLSDRSVEKLRLIGINTPEAGECLADLATARMVELVADRQVVLTIDVSDRDQYGRLLRYVYVGDVSVNETMVREGLALSRRYEPDTAMADLLDAAQSEAQTDRVGMWADNSCGPAPSNSLVIDQVVYDAPGDDATNLNGEYVQITNTADSSVDLTEWVLRDESASHSFTFPTGFLLLSGETVTVFTGCGDNNGTALFWCNTGSAVWNNSGDTAFLLDSYGNIVTFWPYGTSGTAH